jgi:hypothetical protein
MLLGVGGVLHAGPALEISDCTVDGQLADEHFTFQLGFTAGGGQIDRRWPLVGGNVLLTEGESGDGWRIDYDHNAKRYYLVLEEGQGTVTVAASFVVAVGPGKQDPTWREARFDLPLNSVRRVAVTADRKDITLKLDNAVQRKTEMVGDSATISGILTPGAPFSLRWKTQVKEVEAELLVASESSTVMTVNPGALRIDNLVSYDIRQGKLKQVRFAVPEGVSITQVRSEADVPAWLMTKEGDQSILQVTLPRSQEKRYRLQILAERALPQFPTDLEVPVIQPLDGTRADGFVAIGTNSAIQLQVKQVTGVSQVDAAAFPRISLRPKEQRVTPKNKTFYYSFAAMPYSLTVGIADIVPIFDASTRVRIDVKDDDATVGAEIEVDVRDAPIRKVDVEIPVGFVVAGVSGSQVADHGTRESDGKRLLTVEFANPIIGRTLFELQLERGESPLNTTLTIENLNVQSARSERGYVAMTADRGVLVEKPVAEGMGRVHTRSIPMRLPGAQFAWRFRNPGWRLALPVEEKPAAVRADAFHLISLGDGVAYGTVAMTYSISGAPVDELKFDVSEGLENVEFIGLDVGRWYQEDGVWIVKLRRKVIGDYNLGVSYTQRYDETKTITAGGIACTEVETQTGFITIASHRNVEVREQEVAPTLIPIGQEETPSQYRLLVSAPTLRSYKYVSSPHTLTAEIAPYDQGATPQVIVEFVNVATQLSVNDDGEAESVTRVRYTVKNSSAQYLDLNVPQDGPKIWATRLIEKDGGLSRVTKVNSAHKDGILKIPLQRQRNPNAPLTVEVEYGEVHGGLGWRGLLGLSLPRSLVPATYADWRVTAPDGWTVRRAGEDGGAAKISESLSRAGASWQDVLRHRPIIAIVIVAFLIALGVAIRVRKRWLTWSIMVAAVGMLILQLSWVSMNSRVPEPPHNMSRMAGFTQVLDLNAARPLAVNAVVVPDWRAQADLTMIAVLLVLLVVCAFLAKKEKGRTRRVAIAISVAALLAGLSQFPVGELILVHSLTWGLPVIAAIIVSGQLLLRPVKRLAPVAAALALVFFAALPSMALAKKPAPPPVPAVTETVEVKRIATDLVVAEDSVAVSMTLSINSQDGILLPLAPDSALLMERPADKAVRVLTRNGVHAVEAPAGKRNFTIKFVFPAAQKLAEQKQSFSMPLPLSLSNQVTLTVPKTGIEVKCAGSIHITQKEAAGATTATIHMSPGQPLALQWGPQGRLVRTEKTAMYAEIKSLATATSGLVEAVHHVQLQVARGELSVVEIKIPEEMTVTRVVGDQLGTWRFDPTTHMLLVGLDQPVTGAYELGIGTQVASSAMPYTAKIGTLAVQNVERQRGVIGIARTESVRISVDEHPQPMNLEDYLRQMDQLGGNVKGRTIEHAYRLSDVIASVTLTVDAVEPELRSTESASFSISDERLVYNGKFDVEISKAGRFFLDVELPDGYEIDSIACPQLSHWDETTDTDIRVARVHFSKQLLGPTTLTVALSRTVAELPKLIEVPRVSVSQVIKHRGQLVVAAERGVRLAIASRDGVSELDVAQLQLRTKPALAFKLLRPDWQLELQSEVLKPRVNVEFLHLAEVSDGLVRHRHFMRYRLQHAGVKVFEIQLPPNGLGLRISGPEIARKELVDAATGRWRIELSGKWYDRPYPLDVRYESRFDQEAGDVPILPVKAVGADLQKGYVVVRTLERVELQAGAGSDALQPAEARSVPTRFGAGELADAAFCFSSPTAAYDLSFKATRHESADLLEAEVLSTAITSVISEQGDTIHRCEVALRAGKKRHLHVKLPEQAQIWSLLVDRQSRTPSFTNGALLVPLPQSTNNELEARVELVYVIPANSGSTLPKLDLAGPEFDLPLRNIEWQCFLPAGYDYDDFGGTMNVDDEYLEGVRVSRYDFGAYEEETQRANAADLEKAVQLQAWGLEQAQAGNQKVARQALKQAFNYSVSDKSLNEDARVNLRNLMQQQAVVGLVGRRNDVNAERQTGQAKAPQIAEEFTQEQADRLQSSLSKDDSDNLERITSRIIEMQEAAEGMAMQLMVKSPLYGRQIRFTRSLQVKPNSPMTVTMKASQEPGKAGANDWAAIAGLMAICIFLLVVVPSGFSYCTANEIAAVVAPVEDKGAGSDGAAPESETPEQADEKPEVEGSASADQAEESDSSDPVDYVAEPELPSVVAPQPDPDSQIDSDQAGATADAEQAAPPDPPPETEEASDEAEPDDEKKGENNE